MATETFADLLRQARRAAGLTQAGLARRAGLTGSYLSLIESRRRPPPSERTVRALARALGQDPARLLEAAALERTPASVRRRFQRLRTERGRVHQTRDRLLTATLFHAAHRPWVSDPIAEFLDLPPGQRALLGRLMGRMRRMTSVTEAEAQAEDLLEEASPEDRDRLVQVLPRVLLPQGGALPAPAPTPVPPVRAFPVHASLNRREPPEGSIALSEATASPDAFLWRVAGDEAHPRVEAGDLALVDPAVLPQEGDLVAYLDDGQPRLGLYARRGDEVRIAFPRPELPPVRLDAVAFSLVGVVTWVLRRLR
jgi:transcriptional regulator with XRE-family HTH domain